LFPAPSSLPEVGAFLNERYILKKLVAEGGMGAVFECWDTAKRQDLALKVLKPEFVRNEKVVRRFFIEARASKDLRHPNIVTVYDLGVTREGYVYFTMELLKGFSLGDLLSKRRRLSLVDALNIVSQICDALSHAHGMGIVHRDLKPENCYIVQIEGMHVCKVLDFGIAGACDEPSRGRLERVEIFGTPAYMSPEQITGDAVDYRSDLYSLGVILYELVAGFPPFVDESPIVTMKMHLTEKPMPLAALAVAPDVRQRLEDLVMSLLAKSRDERPKSVKEVKEVVSSLLDSLRTDEAQIVDTFMFQEVLKPMRDFVPLYGGKTLELKNALQIHEQPTLAIPSDEAMRLSPTVVMEVYEEEQNGFEKSLWIAERCKVINGEETVLLSFLYASFSYEGDEGAQKEAEALFKPEIEAFETDVMAFGGRVFSGGQSETTCLFGLQGGEESAKLALGAAMSLKQRVERFQRGVGRQVGTRLGIATDRVPVRVVQEENMWNSLSASRVAVARRFSRIALNGGIIVDENTRAQAQKGFSFQEVMLMNARGNGGKVRVFSVEAENDAAKA
jgi:serine/threonine protein kinase